VLRASGFWKGSSNDIFRMLEIILNDKTVIVRGEYQYLWHQKKRHTNVTIPEYISNKKISWISRSYRSIGSWKQDLEIFILWSPSKTDKLIICDLLWIDSQNLARVNLSAHLLRRSRLHFKLEVHKKFFYSN